MTEADREAAITRAALDLRAFADTRIAAGWAPAFAFEDAANKAAHIDSPAELTVQMMTLAAGQLYADDAWPQRDQFVSWWNARFPDAPRVGSAIDLAMPCMIDIGGARAAIAATWSAFCASLGRREEPVQ